MLQKSLIVAATILLSLVALVIYEIYIEPLPDKAERAFLEDIQRHLKRPGDWAKLSDIYHGDWAEVCFVPSMSTSGGNTPESVRKIFNIKTEDINLPNGIPIASDWNSAALFFYPPNTVVGMEIPTNVYLGFRTQPLEGRSWCRRTRDEAVLLMHGYPLDSLLQGITIVTLDQIDKTLEMIDGGQ